MIPWSHLFLLLPCTQELLGSVILNSYCKYSNNYIMSFECVRNRWSWNPTVNIQTTTLYHLNVFWRSSALDLHFMQISTTHDHDKILLFSKQISIKEVLDDMILKLLLFFQKCHCIFSRETLEGIKLSELDSLPLH